MNWEEGKLVIDSACNRTCLPRSAEHVVVEAPSEDSSLTEASTTADCSALLSYSSFADCHRVRVGESACRDDDPTDPHFL